MKKLALFLLPLCLTVIFCGCDEKVEINSNIDMTPRLISTSQNLSSSEIAENVKGAIVGISSKSSQGTSIGSGVAIADGGYVLTNYHVINGGRAYTLYFANNSTGKADFVWGDSSLDLAILKSAKNMPYLDTCPLSDVSIGDDVLAVGTPLSLQFQHTFTKGIVSALNRTIEIDSLGGYTTYMQNLIQHDASINSGNSGGPLINTSGKVIGINSLKASDAEGIGFAIPIETATAIAKRVIPDNNFKQVYLGIFGLDSELAKYKELTKFDTGVYVADIAKDSPFKNSGLEIGDVIFSINGKKIDSILDFRKIIYSLNSGDTVQVEHSAGDETKIETVIIK